jgi:hypothetical protein
MRSSKYRPPRGLRVAVACSMSFSLPAGRRFD